MEERTEQSKIFTGLKEVSFQEERREDAVSKRLSGEIGDESSTDKMRAEPVPNDD